MCKAVEDYAEKKRQEGIIETIKKFIRKGTLSNSEIAETMDMPLEEVQRIAAQIV